VSSQPIRAAYFSDTYLEVDGVANTARQFEAYARRQQLPFLMVHGGYDKEAIVQNDTVTRAELPRCGFGFRLDSKHDFDLVFLRHLSRAEEIVREFKPDVLHITGPSDVGILGTIIAHRLKIPLVASWHTNVHQYAERRALPLLTFLPSEWGKTLAGRAGDWSLLATCRFYKIPRVLLAPNSELIEMLESRTGKRCFLMARGVDTELFHPGKRGRHKDKDVFTIGYVGRITTEKSVEALVEIEAGLRAAGITDYRLLIVGQGASKDYLQSNLRNADFAGVLRGEDLARAYANMDVFAFPSRTDTFGNVVLEAMSSGVPALVTNEGGPQFIVSPGVTGYICKQTADFVDHLQRMKASSAELDAMRVAARKHAESTSWDSVFAAVYGAYEVALASVSVPENKSRINLAQAC
jgi:glycosyltransferase involved in cell wall biosynthesis